MSKFCLFFLEKKVKDERRTRIKCLILKTQFYVESHAF